jgi:hypothetical protein
MVFPSSYNTTLHPTASTPLIISGGNATRQRIQSVEILAYMLQHGNFQLQKGARLMSSYVPLNEFRARFQGFEALARELHRFSVKVSLGASSSFVVPIY